MIRRRHAIPATIASTGYVTDEAPLVAGPAEALTGLARYRELHARLSQMYGGIALPMVMFSAWRYGFVLSGHPISREEDQ